ncbi:MAG: 3-methyl-2-oxobutanoate hydroxymethyltransferase [Arsenophonus sp.]|nr:MAG: 3-methyl-2-oxobutanoate hydroxymethyltransferase [Arsenophonus sp.]
MNKTTINTLLEWKKNKKKFACITAYDFTFANLFSKSGINVILVGDSLGMTIQGYSTTLQVTIQDMIYHTQCVRKGAPDSFIMSDMPFMSYSSLNDAYKNAALLIQSGANMVKIEGGEKWICNIVNNLVKRSIPVCGHLGLTPQSINMIGGYKIAGRNQKDSEKIISNSISLEKSGIQLIVLECIPWKLAQKITQTLSIPVIGIGSGKMTDGQILVMHDILGITVNNIPSFSKKFMNESYDIKNAINKYVKSVENELFPSKEHIFD